MAHYHNYSHSISDVELEIEFQVIINNEIDYDYKYFIVEANFDYQPEEKGDRWYPGCPAAVEGIYDITAENESEQKELDMYLKIPGMLQRVEETIEAAIWDQLMNK